VANPVTNPTVSTTTVCENGVLQLTANPSGGTPPYSYTWTGPNGYVSLAQNPVISAQLTNSGTYSLTITDSCGVTSAPQTTANVTVEDQIVPAFDAIVPAICRNGVAPILSTSSTNGIMGVWSPPVVSNTATATYTFTPNPGQCAETLSLTIFVINNVTPTFSVPFVICFNEPAPALPALSNNGIVGTWSPSTINNQVGGNYTFTPNAGQCAVPLIRTITVTTINPTFDPLPPVCEGLPSPALPPVSTNGITGTWNPATISNTVSGSYVFTPNAGQCAPPFTLPVTIIPNTIPTFDPVAPICENSAPPALPTTSLNGLTGTWTPAVVNNTTTTTYTFTPDPGQCGTTETLQVEVIPNEIPLFDPIDPICVGDPAPALPPTSTNGINGIWTPAIVSNTATGTYTFTPDLAGPCAEPVVITITVNPILTPTFDPILPICSGSIVPLLPAVSNNGVSGTWNPAIINNTTTTTYTFTPDPGECAVTTTLTITIEDNVTPSFDPIAPICEHAIAPILPLVSNNGVNGSWNPAGVSNTATATYTFTPDPGQCALTAQVTVVVQDNIIPTFTVDTEICAGSVAPLLPNISDNGITGTWNPAVIDNSADGSYTFTPDAGLCATTTVVSIEVNPILVPDFDPIAPFCAGDVAPTLPSISNNGISGTWSPAVIDNMLSGVYTFTPNPGECASAIAINVTVNPVIIPIFDPVAPICNGATAPILPLTSNNGVVGTWNPATVSNTATATYTFTADAGSVCTPNTQITVTVNENVTPIFNVDTQICTGSAAPPLPLVSTNGITGTWNPAIVDNTADANYTFTPDAGQCALPATLNITVNPILLPDFNPIGPLCSGNASPILQLVSNNGISGTWNPPTIDNNISGTYTFTPNPGECGSVTTVDVVVNPTIVPVFDPIAPFCAGAPAPILPLVSNNGVSGTWNPATVDNTTSATYTFTPDPGSICTLTAQLSIIVNPILVPSFSVDTQICTGEAAPLLPSVSDNGITGTWAPPIVDAINGGTYVFTTDPGQCAAPGASITISVNPIVTPDFDPIAPICFGNAIPLLPAVSNNGISGTWNPANISNAVSGTYTFTPNPGECGTVTTIDVTVNPRILPIFDPLIPICFGDVPPALPLTSVNGITGTWNPAAIDNSISGTYVFTPDASFCSDPAVLVMTVNPPSLPTFSFPMSICSGDIPPVLPNISDEGYSGSWNPSVIDNLTSNTYVFTPDAGQCALVNTLQITISPNIIPTFNPIGPICYGSAGNILPAISLEGISGTWNPPTIDNTADGNYIFTPDAGQCAGVTSLTINVDPLIPGLFALNTVCIGGVSPVLPNLSGNGITGTWNPPTVDNMVSADYVFTPDPGQCGLVTTIHIEAVQIINPEFSVPSTVCSGNIPPALPLVSDNGISGTWNPAVIDNTTDGSYTFTPNPGECGNPATVSISVVPTITPQFDPIPTSICFGEPAPALPSISLNGVTGVWSPSVIDNTISGIYVFTPTDAGCFATVTVNIIVTPLTSPVFDLLPVICVGDAPPLLPSVSNDGYTGVWTPAVVDNTTSAVYTFTPDAGQCAQAVTLTQTVNSFVIPSFSFATTVCSGSVPPVLPLTSDNGVSGTWNPAIVDNLVSGSYSFTADAGQCSNILTVFITIGNAATLPIFDPIAPFCEGTISPLLQTTSNNGISGTWSPAVIDNINSANYTFTPNPNQCGLPVTISTTVIPAVTAIFDPIPSFCAGETAPLLPNVSNNGITGTWNPAVIDNTASDTYTFTPANGQCAAPVTISVTVITPSTAVFTQIPTVCAGSNAPILPTISNNGIAGSWNPSVVDNQNTGTYVFTPNPGQCATGTTMTIPVLPVTVPVFDVIDPICEQSVAPILPNTSLNGITGTWFPPIVDNTANGIYTFIPSPGQCASTKTILIIVTEKILPYFDPIAPVCPGSVPPVLPLVSPNGISGTWNPATVNTTATTLYTFTPTAGECAVGTTIFVPVAPLVTPVFDPIGPFCAGFALPDLPATSNNGVAGIWNPSAISDSGSYTFTPQSQCGSPTTIQIVINTSPSDLQLTAINPQGESDSGKIKVESVNDGQGPFVYSIEGGTFSAETTFTNLGPGDYTIAVRDQNGCEYSEIVTLVAGCSLPKGFSPNNDGKNDTFKVVGCDIVKLELFNRYGKKVNTFSNYNNEWNGEADNGEQLPTATYFYVAYLTDGTSKTGWVYLNR
ncbi:MAG: hypothetical protein CFE23_00300, partial [Flavobacterium sp. BFFFF1]